METAFKEKHFDGFTWIDICHPNQSDLELIAHDHGLDYFLVCDSMEVGHLPKLEKHDKYNFLIMRAFTADVKKKASSINELSNKIAFFYNRKKIITIHRAPFGFLNNIPAGFASTDDLLLYIINEMINTFIEPTELLSNETDKFEQAIFLSDYQRISLKDLYFHKAQARITKKLLMISQNVVNQLEVNDKSKSALQDIKDTLLNQLLEHDEILEDSNNLLNTYMSVTAQKSNDVMKLLTIFSAFFLPLTFIAGLYGMNFEFMPELKWEFGYFFILGAMIFISITTYLWFKRKRIL